MSVMDDSGWKFIQSNNLSFIVRRCFSTTNFKVLLSDHRRLWSAEGTANELLQMSRKENPLCEFDLSKVTKNIFNLFDKSLNSLSVDKNNETSKTLKMFSSLGNRPFILVWTLNQQDPDALFKEVTSPLLYCVGEMSRRQDFLCGEMIRKDREINEHVLENGPLRWGVKTEKFDEEVFRNESLISSHSDPDPLKSAWEGTGVQGIFNKAIFHNREKNHDESGSPVVSHIIVKHEEMIPDTVHETENEAVILPVKEEKVDEEFHAKPSQTKRKKPKLNF